MATPQPAEQRRLRHRSEARRAILDATEALLIEDGHEAFSMRRLAQRCGYTAPTLYHYFGDKQGLIDALLEERFRRLVALLRRARKGEDALANLRAQAIAFARFGLRNPTHYWLLTLPRSGDPAPPPAAEEARAMMEEPLNKLAAAKRLRVANLEAARQALWALLHGVITLRTSRPDFDWAPRLLEVGLDAMLRGLVHGTDGAAGADSR